MRQEPIAHSGLAGQKEKSEGQRECCEFCRHFHKEAVTGYCQTLCAYVVQSFWCVHFRSAAMSNNEIETNAERARTEMPNTEVA